MGVYKNKNLRRKGPPFVMLDHSLVDSEAWKKLKPAEQEHYIYIKRNYNGSNNGQIPFKYTESKRGPGTISEALKGLIRKQWIEKTKHGGLYRYYCLYKLTGKHDKLR
jgi:hypothetical protein